MRKPLEEYNPKIISIDRTLKDGNLKIDIHSYGDKGGEFYFYAECDDVKINSLHIVNTFKSLGSVIKEVESFDSIKSFLEKYKRGGI